MPENVHWRSRAIPLFSRCGADAKAIEAARSGVEIYPRGAIFGSCWVEPSTRCVNLPKSARSSPAYGRVCSSTAASSRPRTCFPSCSPNNGAMTMPQESCAMSRKGCATPALRLAGWPGSSGHKGNAAMLPMTWSRWSPPARGIAGAGTCLSAGWKRVRNGSKSASCCMTYRHRCSRTRRFACNGSCSLRRRDLIEPGSIPEWGNLLRDFPDDISLSVKRYDTLHASERLDAAAAVLDSILQFDPDNPFILARRTEVLSRAPEKDAALEVALRVCFGPLEESTWPADKVWDVAQAAGFADQLYKQAVRRLSIGEKPTRRSFARMVAHAMRIETKRGLQPRTSTWFLFGGARELFRLGRLVRNAGWDSSSHLAELYRELSDYGYHRVVRRLWKMNSDGRALNIDEWAQVGRALVGAHLHSEGRRFLSEWRERPGIGMWMVANYTLSLSRFRRSQLEELRAACHDALTGLPHDHCASYLAHIQAEACALLSDKEALLQTWNTYSTYFETSLKENEYFHNTDRHLLGDVPMMVRYLQQNQTWLYRKMLWKRTLEPNPDLASNSQRTGQTTPRKHSLVGMVVVVYVGSPDF